MNHPSAYRKFGLASTLLLAFSRVQARGGDLAAIASFNGINGNGPYGHVALDANGNLYGTTYTGGTNNQGTVWEVAKGSGNVATIASFSGTNGANPFSNVTLDANRNLFGTTSGYGADGYGTVWELAKGSSTITALASFTYATGNTPIGNVTLDANGDIFGTGYSCGPLGTGSVWELAKGSSTITVLSFFNIINHEFPNGGDPYGGVTMDSNGNLFGTAIGGGSNGYGTVWEIASAVPEPSSIVTGMIGMALAGGFVLVNRVSARLGRFKSM